MSSPAAGDGDDGDARPRERRGSNSPIALIPLHGEAVEAAPPPAAGPAVADNDSEEAALTAVQLESFREAWRREVGRRSAIPALLLLLWSSRTLLHPRPARQLIGRPAWPEQLRSHHHCLHSHPTQLASKAGPAPTSESASAAAVAPSSSSTAAAGPAAKAAAAPAAAAPAAAPASQPVPAATPPQPTAAEDDDLVARAMALHLQAAALEDAGKLADGGVGEGGGGLLHPAQPPACEASAASV